MDSILRQYSRNTLDFHLPCIATMSGGTPRKSNSEAPPILKQCPVSSKRFSFFQIWLQRPMNHVLVRGDHPLLCVSNVKSGAELGTAEFAARWWLNAVTGFVGSSTFDAIMSAPSLCVVFVQGTWKTVYGTPLCGRQRQIKVECETCQEGMKWIGESTTNSPSPYP